MGGSVMPKTCCVPRCEAESHHHPPVCQYHRDQIADAVLTERHRARQAAREARAWKRAEASVVYYVDLGDRIKIGYTSNLPVRLTQLRVNPDAVLAVEPGARDVEQQRHREFRSIRVTSQREDFWKREPLLTHIETVREMHPQLRRLPDTRTVTVR